MNIEAHPHYQNPDIRMVLDLLVESARDILDENFLGAWLQGSSATGHFDEHSDIDFVIGVERDLIEQELDQLQNFHSYLYEQPSPWAKHLEGSYFPREILRDYQRSGIDIWYLDHGSTTLERSSHDNTIVVKWILREKEVVLAGPDPSSLIDPIPVSELRLDAYRTYANWGKVIFEDPQEIGSHFYQTFAVLGYSRLLNDIRRGEIGSKRAGAEWVKANYDPKWHDLIDRAWLGRPNPALSSKTPADPDDVQRTVEFIRLCLDEAHKLLISFGYKPESDLDTA